jgi:capsular polysaccharide biosynthesis protein
MLEWVVFDVLSFADTVTIFSSAAIIVAPHGAGLTNMLFSDSGIPIIEFMSLQNPNICYWHLSELLKNKYYMIPCITENRNFNIDISNVEELLKNNVKLNDI